MPRDTAICKNTHTHDLETELTTQMFLRRTGRIFIFHVIIAERHQKTNEYFAGTCNDAATRRTKHGTLEKNTQITTLSKSDRKTGTRCRACAVLNHTTDTTCACFQTCIYTHSYFWTALSNCLSLSLLFPLHTLAKDLSRLSRTNNQLLAAISCFQSLGWLPRGRSNSHRHPSFQSTSHSSFRRNVTGK